MPRKKKADIALEEEAKMVQKEKERKFIYSIGRRKASRSRVRVYVDGSGDFIVNKKAVGDYFPWVEYRDIAISPLKEFDGAKSVDVSVKVIGGGARGQAESIRLGVSKALLSIDADLRKRFRQLGYLTRDSRVKERKKPGLKRARRAPQWQKR